MIKTCISDLMMSPPSRSDKVKEIIETSEKNLKLVCDDGEVLVNKEYLMKRSAYCDTLCHSGFVESQSQVVSLAGIENFFTLRHMNIFHDLDMSNNQ